MKMGRRPRCSPVTYRFRYSPSSRLPAAHFDRNDVTIICETVHLCWVSKRSASASVSLLTKCFSYRRLPQASAMLAPTDLIALRNWSVKEYISSLGNCFVTSKISLLSLKLSDTQGDLYNP